MLFSDDMKVMRYIKIYWLFFFLVLTIHLFRQKTVMYCLEYKVQTENSEYFSFGFATASFCGLGINI